MHIRFDNLPSQVQKEVLRHLKANNFREAKRLRDIYEISKAQKSKIIPTQEAKITQQSVQQTEQTKWRAGLSTERFL